MICHKVSRGEFSGSSLFSGKQERSEFFARSASLGQQGTSRNAVSGTNLMMRIKTKLRAEVCRSGPMNERSFMVFPVSTFNADGAYALVVSSRFATLEGL